MSKILMVDDDKNILDENRQYFEAMGYEVICAETAEAAEKSLSPPLWTVSFWTWISRA